eukprot:136496_1
MNLPPAMIVKSETSALPNLSVQLFSKMDGIVRLFCGLELSGNQLEGVSSSGPNVTDHLDEKTVSIGPPADPSDLHVEVDAQDEEIAHECQRVYVSKEMRMEL